MGGFGLSQITKIGGSDFISFFASYIPILKKKLLPPTCITVQPFHNGSFSQHDIFNISQIPILP